MFNKVLNLHPHIKGAFLKYSVMCFPPNADQLSLLQKVLALTTVALEVTYFIIINNLCFNILRNLLSFTQNNLLQHQAPIRQYRMNTFIEDVYHESEGITFPYPEIWNICFESRKKSESDKNKGLSKLTMQNLLSRW